MQAIEKFREPVINILQEADFKSLPKQFYPVIMLLLEINDFKMMNIKNVADKIILIYEQQKGNYQRYLAQKKFNDLHQELKEYVWNIFKKMHEYVMAQRPTQSRSQFHQNKPELPINMFNMFLNVPKLQNTQQIQFFQRRMYQVCKNSMPQVMQNLALNASKRSNGYRQQQQQQNYPGNFKMNFNKPPQYQMPSSSFAPYYQNSNSNYQRQPSIMGGNNNTNSYRGDNAGFTNMKNYCNDQKLEYGNPRNNQVFSHQRISSPRKENEPKKFYSQNNIQFQDRNTLNEGFTLYSPIEKPLQRKPAKNLNKQLLQSSEWEPELRKIVKKDQLDDIKNQLVKQQFPCNCEQYGGNKLCQFCYIQHFDPFSQVTQVIKLFTACQKNLNCCIKLEKQVIDKICSQSEDYDLQIRSMKIDSAQQDLQWPESIKILVNSAQINQFSYDIKKAISKKQPQNYFSFKKYSDQPIFSYESINIQIQAKQNIDAQSNNKDTHIIGIFLVKKLSIQKVNEQIKKKIKIRNISEFFQPASIFQGASDANKLKIEPADRLTKQIIDDPVRGVNCKHAQCFDLKTFVQYQKFAQSRSWLCPICSKSSKQLVLDEELKQIFGDVKKMIKQPTQIIVFKSGGYKYIYDSEKKQQRQQTKKQKQKLLYNQSQESIKQAIIQKRQQLESIQPQNQQK